MPRCEHTATFAPLALRVRTVGGIIDGIGERIRNKKHRFFFTKAPGLQGSDQQQCFKEVAVNDYMP